MSLRRSRLTCQNWGPDRRGSTKLPLESGMIADDDNHPGCSRQRSTFNVRLQSAIRCIPTCKGRRQAGVDEIQQLDHWWFCRGRRTKRGRVPSSGHGGRVLSGGIGRRGRKCTPGLCPRIVFDFPRLCRSRRGRARSLSPGIGRCRQKCRPGLWPRQTFSRRKRLGRGRALLSLSAAAARPHRRLRPCTCGAPHPCGRHGPWLIVA
jgi:hypothetical protein